MRIQTVTGDIPASAAGIVLPHEHVVIDLRPYWGIPSFWGPRIPRWKRLVDEKVKMSILGDLKENPELAKDNVTVSSVQDIAEELTLFKKAGGGTIVDATPDGLGRNPKALKKASQLSGINIVGGSGYYIGISQPPRVRRWSVERMTKETVKDLTKGIRDTGIKSGVIGEVGAMSDVPNELEVKSMKACARAQAETGTGMIVHTTPGAASKLLDILEENGADLRKVVAAHADSLLEGVDPPSWPRGHAQSHLTKKRPQKRARMAHYSKLLDRGAYIAFDGFGVEYWYALEDLTMYARPRDIERVMEVVELVQRGYTSQILLSGDSCFKSGMKKYGGFGWEHIPLRVAPLLRWAGLSESNVQTIIAENPMRLLAIK